MEGLDITMDSSIRGFNETLENLLVRVQVNFDINGNEIQEPTTSNENTTIAEIFGGESYKVSNNRFIEAYSNKVHERYLENIKDMDDNGPFGTDIGCPPHNI